MLAYDTTTLTVFVSVFFALAAIVAIVSVAAFSHFVVTNRRARLAQNESFRSYYRGFALTH